MTNEQATWVVSYQDRYVASLLTHERIQFSSSLDEALKLKHPDHASMIVDIITLADKTIVRENIKVFKVTTIVAEQKW
jgi:hypothetical protein